MRSRVGQQFGNYHLVRLIGRSGLTEVYLGQHVRRSAQQAAIKILAVYFDEADIQALEHEAETLASLVHPHIVRVLDFDVTDGLPFFVMDYIPNGSLRQRHRPSEQVELSTVVTYVQQVADGLQYAHDQKYIHCCISPDNMLIGKHGEILLSDFGIAAITHRPTSQSCQMDIGIIPYIAPEQILGHPQPASDQYALAITVYEWLAGEHPFNGSYTEIAVKHAMMPPPPLRTKRPALSPETEAVILTALAKDPNARFGSIQAFATALNEAGHSSGRARLSSTAQLAQTPTSPAAPASREAIGATSMDTAPPFPRRVVRIPRLIIWLAFLVLLLAMYWHPEIFVQFIENALSSPSYGLLASTGVALIGLLFFLMRKHPFIDSIGSGTLRVMSKVKQLAVPPRSSRTLLQASRMFAVHAIRVVAWLAFLVSTLAICWRTETFMQFIGDIPTSHSYGPLALGVASAGAILVGLVFLLTRQRAFIDIIGGSALTVFGSLTSLTFLHWAVAACFSGFGIPLQLSCSPFQNPLTLHPIQSSFISYPSLILFMSILMLYMGTYFVIRSANALGGFILAALLLVEALLQRIVVYPPQSYLADTAPVILFWLPPTLLGVTAITVSLLKIRYRRKPS